MQKIQNLLSGRARTSVSSGRAGFTLIEILVVIGIIAILAAIVLVALNPARQFALGRDSQRTSNTNAILNAIGQNIAEHQGNFTCAAAGALPTGGAQKMSNTGGTDYDIRGCIVPDYMPEITVDPDNTFGTEWDGTNYDTGYTVEVTGDGRIQVCAPSAEENDPDDDGTVDPICVTR